MRQRTLIIAAILVAAIAPARAQDRIVSLLQQITDTPGPPGFEEPIRKVMVAKGPLVSVVVS